MAGTSAGAKKAAQAWKERDPLYYQKLGRKGGLARRKPNTPSDYKKMLAKNNHAAIVARGKTA